MNDKKKYLKYKSKYINLKNILGGGLESPDDPSRLPDDPSRLPDNPSRLPDDLSRLPDDLSRLPDDPTRLPDDPLKLSDDPSLQVVLTKMSDRILSQEERQFESNIELKVIEDKKGWGVFSKLPNELFVIGDIHGDFFTLKQSLELTGCIEFEEYTETIEYDGTNKLYTIKDGCEYYSVDKNNVRWNPTKINSFIVLAGDIVDRCRPHPHSNCINTVNDENCDYQILKLLLDLDLQAQKYDSRIIIVLGNHEILNLSNDLRYVSNKGRNDEKRLENLDKLLKNNIQNIFGIVRINRYVIVHGGINDLFFDKVNMQYNKYLKNSSIETIEVYNNHLRKFITDKVDTILESDKKLQDKSPFWDRTLGGVDTLNIDQCTKIFKGNILNIKPFLSTNYLKVIVAHCPQFVGSKNINLVDCQDFKNRIYRIDVGMSRAFDSYKNNSELNTLLNGLDMTNILDTNYKSFYNYNSQDEKNRVVSILKINNTSEVVINGSLSIDYFYKTVFKENKKDLLLYLLSDLKKINLQSQHKSLSPHILSNLLIINILIEQLCSK